MTVAALLQLRSYFCRRNGFTRIVFSRHIAFSLKAFQTLRIAAPGGSKGPQAGRLPGRNDASRSHFTVMHSLATTMFVRHDARVAHAIARGFSTPLLLSGGW